MPTYTIAAEAHGIRIEVSDTAGKTDAFLNALQECREGRCSCPTSEYEKLADMRVTADTHTIQVELQTKPGAQLETEAVRKCLDFAMGGGGAATTRR